MFFFGLGDWGEYRALEALNNIDRIIGLYYMGRDEGLYESYSVMGNALHVSII
jgi:hypothetical protein